MSDTPARTAWFDLSCGVSGDMLLGALLGAGVPLDVLRQAIGQLGLPVSLQVMQARRAGLAAHWVVPTVNEPQPHHRPWATIRDLLTERITDPDVRDDALRVFGALAAAEGEAHGCDPETVVFHEVGAHDALADIVGTCAGLRWLRSELGVTAVHASPVALGGGTVVTAHGEMPVPAPAVLRLLVGTGIPSYGGPEDVELATPTGVALVASLVEGWGFLPPQSVEAVGIGAGAREIQRRPNVVRLVIGTPVTLEPQSVETAAECVPSLELAIT